MTTTTLAPRMGNRSARERSQKPMITAQTAKLGDGKRAALGDEVQVVHDHKPHFKKGDRFTIERISRFAPGGTRLYPLKPNGIPANHCGLIR